MVAQPQFQEEANKASSNLGSTLADSTASYTKAARDLLIVAIIIFAFLKPDLMFDRISRLGISELDGPGFKASFVESHSALLKAGAALSSTEQAVDGVIVQLGQLDDPRLSNVIAELDVAKDQATQKAHAVLSTALQQQQQNEAILPTSDAAEGWIYLARINGNGAQWKSTPVIAGNYSPKTIIGQEVTLARGVFLHKGPVSHDTKSDPPGWRANQSVAKVLRDGTRIKVVRTEINKALGGGESLWALIDVLD